MIRSTTIALTVLSLIACGEKESPARPTTNTPSPKPQTTTESIPVAPSITPATDNTIIKPEFVIDGIYANMPAAEAKAAGYSKCSQENGSNTVKCTKTPSISQLGGATVKYIYAHFAPPFDKVSMIEIKMADKKLTTPECKVNKNSKNWIDHVEKPDCFISPTKALTTLFGKHKNYNNDKSDGYGPMTTWHNCGPYIISLLDEFKEARVTYDPTWSAANKSDCDRIAKENATSTRDTTAKNTFINQMK